MRSVFSDYVRALEPGGEPDPERFRTLWEGLRAAVVAELRKRSLWSAPASYLGLCGWRNWSEEGALEELLIDCYTFVFVERLEALKALLDVRDNVDGLVFRNIRNFLYNLQKKHDPLGFRVFAALQAAARQAIAAQTLYVVAGDPGVRNDTLLAFAPWPDPGPAQGTDLSALVQGWSDDLLPELVTGRGAELDALTSKLVAHFARLADEGVEVFRFKDVIKPLKDDVRTRWNVIWQHAEGETAIAEGEEGLVELVRLVRPDSGLEERQAFEQLLICVAEALARIEGTEKTRGYLHKLWVFVRAHVVEDHGDKLPARQKIAASLGIPRYRLPELFDLLGREVERCRTAGRRPAPEEATS